MPDGRQTTLSTLALIRAGAGERNTTSSGPSTASTGLIPARAGELPIRIKGTFRSGCFNGIYPRGRGETEKRGRRNRERFNGANACENATQLAGAAADGFNNTRKESPKPHDHPFCLINTRAGAREKQDDIGEVAPHKRADIHTRRRVSAGAHTWEKASTG